MDIGPELTTNDHVQDETTSPKKRRLKITGAAEAPPAKRIKSSTETTRPKVPRASTTRTRAAKLGDSKWFTVAPSITRQVPSDLVLVDTRPRLWSTNRAELGSAFSEIADSKCVNGISWTLTDMPIIILDNESMVLEKPKDAGNELSMDLVFIREFRYANLNTLEKHEDSVVYDLKLSQSRDDSRPEHSLAAAPSIKREAPDGPPMRKFPQPIPVAEHATMTLSTSIPPPIPESKPEAVLQEQGVITEKSANESLSEIPPRAFQKEFAVITTEAHRDPTPPLLTENPVSQSKQGRQPPRALQKTADKPFLKPVQHVSKSEELEISNNDSVPASSTDHGSAILPDTLSSNTGDTPKRKRGRPPKVQDKPSDGSVLDPEKAVSQSKGQGKPVYGSPPASTQIPDPSKSEIISTAKAERVKKQQEVPHKSTTKAILDTSRNASRSKKRENANASLPVPAQVPDPSNSTTAAKPKPKQGGQMSRKAPGVLRLKEQRKSHNETQPVAELTSDHTESMSTATSKPEAKKSNRKSLKTLGLSTNELLPEKSDTPSLTSRSNTGLRSKGAKGKQRWDSEEPAHAPLRSGLLPKPEREAVRRAQKATKGSSKRARSPGSSISTPAYARKPVREERGPPVREHQSKSISQLSQKKEPAKPIKDSLPSVVRTASELLGGGRKSVYSTLRFTKKKDAAIDAPIPKVSDNVASEAVQPSVPTPSPTSAPAFVPAPVQPASTIEDARGHSNHLHRNSYSNKGASPRRTPDISMPDLENIMQTRNDLDPLFRHYPDNRTLPNLNKFMQGFAETRDGAPGMTFQGPSEPFKEALKHVLVESATQQIELPSNHSAPTTSDLQPKQGQRKEPEIHPRLPILSTDAALRSLRFTKDKEAPKDIPIPRTSETSLSMLRSFPEERHAHLDGYSLRHDTPDTSMSDLDNVIRNQEGHFVPAFGHYPDNRLLPNFNRLPLAFTRHDTPVEVPVARRDIVNIESRTRNQMDSRRDGSWAGRASAHVGSVETCQNWTARWEPPHREQALTGGWAEQRAPWRDSNMDTFNASQARFGTEMRHSGSGWRDIPLAQNARGAPRRAGHLAWQGALRAHSHSPIPTSHWVTTDFDKRARSAPYSKAPPLGPRRWRILQEANSETVVTRASEDQVAAVSNSRNLSPNLQKISESAIAIPQTQSPSTPTTSSIKDITMVSLPDELTQPAPSTRPLQTVAPDDASLANQKYAPTQTFLSTTTSSANDITMGGSADEPLLPASPAPVPIEQMSVPTVSSDAPKIPAVTDISMEMQTDKPASCAPSTEPLALSTAAPPPYLKRKGKEKALASEGSNDESSTIQDEVRRAKKAKLWHDPVIDVSRMFDDLIMPIACSSKTKLEDLPVPQSSRFPQAPDQTNAMAVEGQPSSLSISSSTMKPAKRRGRPPKNAKVASSSSGSTTTIKKAPAREKVKEHQPPSISRSVPDSTCSSQAPPQISVMVSEDQCPSASVSVAAKSAKRRGRQTVKVAASSSAPTLSITSKPTFDELPSISCSLPKSPKKAQVDSSLTPVQWREDGVPLPIPVEIQALVDAYINGVPIGVFASSSHIQGFWGLKLTKEEEIGYAFMGFYRVCRVLESLDESEVYGEENEKDKKGKGKAVVASEVSKTRVRWRFKLRWEPGGEGWQIRDPQRLTTPWWNSNLKAQELAVVPRNNSGDSDDESTETYRLARRGSQNFCRRHCYFDQTFCSVLPLHLLAPVDAEIPDAVLPRGWHCPDCGKLNFRYYFRHRRCDSSYCQDKPIAQGYMVEVDRLRDPQDGTPLSLPLNNVPEHIRANSRIQVWNDRMKTLIYCFETGIVGGMARIQHIFTCNLVDLQKVSSELFNSIQMDVPLRRPTGDAHAYPYFEHFVDEVRGKAEDSNSWVTAPQCLHRAKEVMNSRGRKYGKKTAAELDINRLIIRAWITSGSKRGSDLLQAKERCIVVMCLGCEVILSISPKSAMPPNDNQTRPPDLDKLIPMESLDPQEDQLTKPEPGESIKLELGEKESQLHLVSTPSTMRGVMGKNQKGEKVEVTLSLVHGDVVLLEGDDFEYSIKRTGTSILLFGLSMPSRRPQQVLNSRRG